MSELKRDHWRYVAPDAKTQEIQVPLVVLLPVDAFRTITIITYYNCYIYYYHRLFPLLPFLLAASTAIFYLLFLPPLLLAIATNCY